MMVSRPMLECELEFQGSRYLAKHLARYRSQVTFLVVHHSVTPYDEDDLQPFSGQRTQSMPMFVPSGTLLAVIRPSPLTEPQGNEGQLGDGVAQMFVTGEAEQHSLMLATLLRHRNGAGFSLKVLKGLPPVQGVSQLGPQGRHRGATLAPRQAAGYLSQGHRDEKTLHLTGILLHLPHHHPQLGHQSPDQAAFGPFYVGRYPGSVLPQRLLQLLSLCFPQAMLPGEAFPIGRVHLLGGSRRWVGLQEVQGPSRTHIWEYLQGQRIELFQGRHQLVDQPCLVFDQTAVVAGQEFKLLGFGRARPQRSQVTMIGAQKLGQHPGVKPVALGPTGAEPVPGPVQAFGVDRVDHDVVVQEELHNPAMGLFDGCPELDVRIAAFMQPAAKVAQFFRSFLHHPLLHAFPSLIPYPHRVFLVGPVNPDVPACQLIPSVRFITPGPQDGRTAYSPYIGLRGGNFPLNLAILWLTGTVCPGSSLASGSAGPLVNRLNKERPALRTSYKALGLAGVALADHTILPISGIAVVPAFGVSARIQPLVLHLEDFLECSHGSYSFVLIWCSTRHNYNTTNVICCQ